MAEICETPVTSRRSAIKKGAVIMAGVWAAPMISRTTAAAAGTSGVRTATTTLNKSVNNNTDPPIGTLCTVGAKGNAPRGDVTFTRFRKPAATVDTISVTILLTTGTPILNRDVFILQSNATTCLGGTAIKIGNWSGAGGAETFETTVVSGATAFVVLLALSGGGGNDGYSSRGPTTLI